MHINMKSNGENGNVAFRQQSVNYIFKKSLSQEMF